jgi:hypothetical protein
MIVHDGVTFGDRTGAMQVSGVSQGLQELAFPGVLGVAHLVDARKSRRLRCTYTIDGRASAQVIHNVISEINSYQGRLTGTVTGPNSETYERCTFLGFTPAGPLQYSAGGTVGWLVRGTLEWIQRRA